MKKYILFVILTFCPILTIFGGVKIDGYKTLKGVKYTLYSNGTASAAAAENRESYELSSAIYTGGTQLYIVNAIGVGGFAHTKVKSIPLTKNIETIGSSAFVDCPNLTSITIPNHVKYIRSTAFQWCLGLKKVALGTGITTIEEAVFADCPNLSEITMSRDVTEIGMEAFANCTSLSTFFFPDAVKIIGDRAFHHCSGLTYVGFGRNWNNYTTIGKAAFEGCYSLRTLMLPNTISYIGERAFNGCSGLMEVMIGQEDNGDFKIDNLTSIGKDAFCNCSGLIALELDKVSSIGEYAFASCSNLSNFTIPNSVKKIGKGAFHNCTSLTDLIIPASVESIEDEVFEGCKSLISVFIPNGILSIGKESFSSCSGLTSITIPNSVTSIGSLAFQGCSSLTSLVIGSGVTSIGASAFRNCSLLTSLIIPEGVETIGNRAFQACYSLKKLEIPSTLTSVDVLIINGNSSLESVISYMTNPINVDEKTFANEDNTPSSATLYVPEGTKSKYEVIAGWTKFAAIEEMPAEVPITFGDKPVTTYTANYNLDFSGTDEIKAYVATGYDYDSGTVWLTRVKDVPEGMPVMIMGTAKETYDIPVKLTSGTYFKNMFVANTTGNTMTLPQTSGDMTNYYLSNGIFKTSTGTNPINPGKCYLQIPTVAPTPVEGSSKDVTMNKNGYASFCANQDLDFTDVEGLKAYAATGYDDASGTIWLTRVKRVSAGTGVLLMGAASGSYTIPSTAVKSYYANMMVGNTGTSDITIYTTSGDMTNYYLSGNKLLKATTAGNPIKPGKAYMQIPSAHVTRSIGDDPTENLSVYDLLELPEVISMQVMTRGIDGGDDTTGVHEAVQPEQTNDVYYNLNGQRVNNPGKGLYIKNGKKVILK